MKQFKKSLFNNKKINMKMHFKFIKNMEKYKKMRFFLIFSHFLVNFFKII